MVKQNAQRWPPHYEVIVRTNWGMEYVWLALFVRPEIHVQNNSMHIHIHVDSITVLA